VNQGQGAAGDAHPRIPAYREAGWETSDDDDAYSNACRLERRPRIKDRIEYLSKQQEELIAEKRQRIEERLWAIHDDRNWSNRFSFKWSPLAPPLLKGGQHPFVFGCEWLFGKALAP
jgi:hypothetical protein